MSDAMSNDTRSCPMTADVKLLPSSVAAFTEALHGDRGSLDAWLEVNDEREVRAHVEAYARANIGIATAAKDAEIEALRAEVERLRADRDSWEQQASDRVADWHAEHLRAERMAEALEDIRSRSSINLAMRSNPFDLTARLGDIHQIADAALRQWDGWQPMETAPKDGTCVLLWFEWNDEPVVGDFRHGRWWSTHTCGGNLSNSKGTEPTHWRPLPAPPAIDQARGKENGND